MVQRGDGSLAEQCRRRGTLGFRETRRARRQPRRQNPGHREATARTSAPAGEISPNRITADKDMTTATAIGTSARMTTSPSASTSAPVRASRSPRRSPAAAAGSPSARRRRSGPRRRRATQRGVVRREALEVAEEAPGDAQRSHRDHRDGEVQDRRHLPCPGDQPRRQRRQRECATERCDAGGDCGQDPARFEVEQADRPHQITIHVAAPRLPAAPPPGPPVARREHGRPVADHHDGAALLGEIAQGSQHGAFGVVVEVRGGLVEQQHRARRHQ